MIGYSRDSNMHKNINLGVWIHYRIIDIIVKHNERIISECFLLM